ncbi:DUF1613-domain-containing protein [Aspergillus campestris IBT 28561]|uniref:tRNA (uracil-O(2)-)-methyltransferase n=1 Tax=Aspergillus campestris (strain IBT 28561) TaxID=1392248 RepID=A0A2I1CXD1_ASPC2|nr:DUF1613-domain-containing protein [Aspergillus campestris IBT 28561]PKY02263.1 DUF1613-domain-containing protein [Aspergillus campestris IBT 28561]
MPKNRKNPRDASKLSGKPLADTLEPSPILSPEWTTSRDLIEHDLPFSPEVIKDLTVFLLENININATHLFRADILYDSWGALSTPQQKAQSFAQAGNPNLEDPAVASPAHNDLPGSHVDERVGPLPAIDVPGFALTRTVVRNLIPRNPKIDRPLAQTCHFYEATNSTATSTTNRFLIIYIPHLTTKEEVPFYHPLLRALATLYDFTDTTSPAVPPSDHPPAKKGSGTLSLHFLLFPNEPIPTRLERTLHALLSTQIRLARGTRLADKPPGATSGNTNPIKDNVIPQHLVQNTYLRIKLKYAPALCRDWVEDTEPSKHVFEDLAIAAFLIELWRSMYGAVPGDERDSTQSGGDFPGFVDVACGNGLLVYVLLQEGYSGWGFDARARKTWGIFPADVRARLREEIYIPKPFADAITSNSDSVGEEDDDEKYDFDVGVPTHTGSFPADTFIISNHADELTVWTPLMAALANPSSPLPFLAIPCCSHALSGARHRYPPPKGSNKHSNKKNASNGPSHDHNNENEHENENEDEDEDEQPTSGDLAALRQKKQQATDPSNAGFDSSMYGSLTAKTVAVATEVGYDVERTLLRIPSTRNMGVLGGRVRTTREWWVRRGVNNNNNGNNGGAAGVGHGHGHGGEGSRSEGEGEVLQKATHLVQKECRTEGGVEAAAKIWVERARGLHRGQGRGKQPKH